MSLFKLASQRAFVLLAGGEAASLIGDQFTRIAAIWLVLDLTNDSAAVGLWLAFGAVPRAAFLLVGGALIDRFDPRTMMIVSNLARLLLVLVLTGLALAGGVTMPVLYGFAILFGAAGALYLPAVSVIVPRIVPAAALRSGNAVVQGLMHLANLIGPPLAALALAALLGEMGARPAAEGQRAYAVLLAIDALTFLLSLWALFLIGNMAGPSGGPAGGLTGAVGAGLRHVIRHPNLRIFVLIAVIANFGLGGPLAVGLPLLAKFALPQGVTALGILSAAASAGSLAGLGIAAILPQRDERRLFAMPFLFLPILGLLMISLGHAVTLERAAGTIGIMAAMGLYLDVQIITRLQQTTDRDYLGRVMSILQFGALGLTPISMALAGFLGTDLPFMFAAFGIFIIVMTAVLAFLARHTSGR
ncbi:MAG: MFS transporter [Alphaproteobacteria bacterium]